MALAPVGVSAAQVALVSDERYLDTVLHLVETATRRALASVFIVDLNAHHDPDTKVVQVIGALGEAAWRGLDARLLIGGSNDNLAIEEACWIARAWASDLGVACKILSAAEVRGSHSKYVIADDVIVTGSHNWSLSAFAHDLQDSLLVRSPALAALMSTTFDDQWTRAAVAT